MDRLVHIALSGLRGAMARQTATANNLANANTAGFRAEIAEVRPLWVQGSGLAARASSSEEVLAADMRPGTTMDTGRGLDIALLGQTMLAVQGPEGDEAYTRRGDLQRADSGLLTTGDGYPLIGRQGPITLPPVDSLKISEDGQIWVVPAGGDPNTPQQIDQLKLTSPVGSRIVKGLDGLFRVEGGGRLPVDGAAKLKSGTIEGSNVNPTKALVDMIEASRSWDNQLKLISAAREIDTSATDLMRLPD